MSAKAEAPIETERLTEVSIATLLQHPFTSGLKHDHLRRLCEISMLANFKAHDELLKEGEPANRFYLLLSGSVAIEWTPRERTKLIQVLGAGDVLGWSWLFPPYRWRFSARTLEATRAVFCYATPLRDECESDHQFGYELMKRVASVMLERLQSTRKRLVEAELKNAITSA